METQSELEISQSRITAIARACHEVNRAYCEAIGDMSHKPWEDTPADIQQSSVSGVIFRLMNPDTTPQEQHETWKTFKKSQGWAYGAEKDLEKKTHPCIVDKYEDLPQAERVKDYLFAVTVKQVLRAMKEESSDESERAEHPRQ